MPYADKEQEKAKKRRWYAKKLKEREFAKAEKARKEAWLATPKGRELARGHFRSYGRRQRPQTEYRDFNLDDHGEVKAFLALTDALRAIGVKFREHSRDGGTKMTVSFAKRDLGRLEKGR